MKKLKVSPGRKKQSGAVFSVFSGRKKKNEKQNCRTIFPFFHSENRKQIVNKNGFCLVFGSQETLCFLILLFFDLILSKNNILDRHGLAVRKSIIVI